jgi:hypothetical protein
MGGVKVDLHDRTKILNAVDLTSQADFIRKAIEVGEQMDVRRPANANSGESVLGRFLRDEDTGLSTWMRDLFVFTAEEIFRIEGENATADDLREALHQERQKTEDYRESALKKEAMIRGKDAEISRLQADLKLVKGSKKIITEVEQQALVILREIVMADNGDLDPLLLKASRLVIRAEVTDQS